MGIYLCGGYALVSQDHLKVSDIDMTVFVHKGSGGVPELMYRIYARIDTGLFEEPFNDDLDHVIGDTCAALGYEKGFAGFGLDLYRFSLGEPVVQSGKAGVIKIDCSFFIAFTDNGEGGAPYIIGIDATKL